MTTRVRKYPLGFAGVVELNLPEGAEALRVSAPIGIPILWARVDEKRPLTCRSFLVGPSGEALDDDVGAYVGSVELRNGELVIDVFELVRISGLNVPLDEKAATMSDVKALQVSVAARHGVTVDELIGKSRHSVVTRARHEAMKLARVKLRASYALIGRSFNRDHSTVVAACKKGLTSP